MSSETLGEKPPSPLGFVMMEPLPARGDRGPSAFNTGSYPLDKGGSFFLSLMSTSTHTHTHTHTETGTTNQQARVAAFKIQKVTCSFIKVTSLPCAGAGVLKSQTNL